MKAVSALQPSDRNARTHSGKQVKQIAASIQAFGFNNPVLLTEGGAIVAGHGRVAAAKQLGTTEVPTLVLGHLSPEEVRAYMLAGVSAPALPSGERANAARAASAAFLRLGFERVGLIGHCVSPADAAGIAASTGTAPGCLGVGAENRASRVRFSRTPTLALGDEASQFWRIQLNRRR